MSDIQDIERLAIGVRDAANALAARCEKARKGRPAQEVSRDIRRDVRDLVAYNWADEEEDFKTSTQENGPQPGHIFHVLKRLNAWAQ